MAAGLRLGKGHLPQPHRRDRGRPPRHQTGRLKPRRRVRPPSPRTKAPWPSFAATSSAERRECTDRRRGAGRLHRRVLPCQGRHQRDRPGKDQLPAREGLRRRPHPAGGPRNPEARPAAPGSGRLAPEQGPAPDRRRPHHRAALARGVRLPAVRPDPHAPGLRRGTGPPRPGRRRRNPRAAQRHRSPPLGGRPRDRSPRSAPGRVRTQDGGDARLQRRRRTRRGRQLHPNRRVAWASRSATTGRSASPSAPTSPARATTTTGWKAGWSSPAATANCCPATAGCSASATAPPTWAWAS